MQKIIFCHGLESAPHGRKYHALVAAGFEVRAPDFRSMNLQQRVHSLTTLLRDEPAQVIVGSSYGGITALCAAIELRALGRAPIALILCAPALARPEPPANRIELIPPCPTTIVHGTKDTVIPIAVSRAFASAHPSLVHLLEVDDAHELKGSLDVIVDAVRQVGTESGASSS